MARYNSKSLYIEAFVLGCALEAIRPY